MVCQADAWRAPEGSGRLDADRAIVSRQEILKPAVPRYYHTVSIPITPSGIGPYELAVQEVLVLLGLSSALAGGYAIGTHLALIIWITLVGLVAMWAMRLSPDIGKAGPAHSHPTSSARWPQCGARGRRD